TLSLPFAGEELTNNISSELKISWAEAEKMKKGYGEKDKNTPLEKIILSFFDNLSQTLKTHLSFYEEGVRKKIEEIILCGGGANLFNLVPFLEKKLKIKVKKGNPWLNIIKKDEKPPLPEDISLVYTTAIGLALRGLKEKI
ncbi:MAG: pilus assembly protein PilM, partial [Patescibacteria group bacterium]